MGPPSLAAQGALGSLLAVPLCVCECGVLGWFISRLPKTNLLPAVPVSPPRLSHTAMHYRWMLQSVAVYYVPLSLPFERAFLSQEGNVCRMQSRVKPGKVSLFSKNVCFYGEGKWGQSHSAASHGLACSYMHKLMIFFLPTSFFLLLYCLQEEHVCDSGPGLSKGEASLHLKSCYPPP